MRHLEAVLSLEDILITRADIAGALKLIHSNSLTNRRGHLHNMISAEHPPHEVAKILSDIESYAGWSEHKHLDAVERPAPKRPSRK